jgi:uncharacterized protein YoxC
MTVVREEVEVVEEGAASVVGTLAGPVGTLVDSVGTLVGKVGTLADAVDALVDAVDALVDAVGTLADTVGTLVGTLVDTLCWAAASSSSEDELSSFRFLVSLSSLFPFLSTFLLRSLSSRFSFFFVLNRTQLVCWPATLFVCVFETLYRVVRNP